ncbi:MAG TPA: hypothetical protein VLI90_20955 [Tepidisphaeraceae bacterium]|nr:hypothetical protein [Tepidisphaeraceae bacterium]
MSLAIDVETGTDEVRTDRHIVPVLVAIAIFAGLSLWAAIKSDGFLEADSCTHYIYARYAFAQPHLFVNIWGRPVCTGIYSIGAHFAGRMGVRVTSLIIAIAIALIVMQIARGMQWGATAPTLALIFTLAQPLVFLHSFSELTELPFALLVALGFWAYQRQRWLWFALAIGMTPLSRPEGFGLLALAAVALLLHRRWSWLALLALPLVAWDYCGWVEYGRVGPWWNWLRANWPYEQKSLYTPGPLYHFLLLMPVVTSPLIFPAMVVGAWRCLTPDLRKKRQDAADPEHLQRCNAIIALLPLSILVGHSLLYWLGKMASNGELRYLLVVAPFWALLAARGWSWVFQETRWQHAVAWAAAAALAPVMIHLTYPVLPLHQQPDWVEAQQIAQWYQDSSHDHHPYLATAHPGILYHLDLSPSDGSRVREWRKDVLDAVPPGTTVVWDPIYGVFNSDKSRSISAEELLNAGWKEVQMPWGGSAAAGKWRVFQSQPITAKSKSPLP